MVWNLQHIADTALSDYKPVEDSVYRHPGEIFW